MLMPRRDSSSMWRAMCAHGSVMLIHARWIVGDGRSIRVLSDPWLFNTPLCLMPTTLNVKLLENAVVSDLMIEG